jgi:hypothetical protein
MANVTGYYLLSEVICRTDKLDLSLGLLRLVGKDWAEVILIESHNFLGECLPRSYNKTYLKPITRKLLIACIRSK